MRRSLVIALALVALLAAGAGYVGIDVIRTALTVSSDPLGLGRGQSVGGPGQASAQSGVADALAQGQRVNVLLLGYGGAGHDGANLTDSIMVVSLDPATHVATLLSVPRDLWVTIPDSQWDPAHDGKVNEAFAEGADHGDRDAGLRLAVQTLEPILGIHIDRSVALDFTAFRTVVNAIGGVDVTVDRSFTSRYPANDDAAIDPSWITLSFDAGPQHMDGEQALRFARARYATPPEDTDFARSARQQKIVLAARDKIEASNSVPMLLGLMDALRDNVRTDLSVPDMRALADFAKGYDDASTIHGALTDSNVLEDVTLRSGEFTLQPRTSGWDDVRAYVAQLFSTAAAK